MKVSFFKTLGLLLLIVSSTTASPDPSKMPARVGPIRSEGERGLAPGDIVLSPLNLPSQGETVGLPSGPRSNTITGRDPFIVTIESEPENPQPSSIFEAGCTYMKDHFDIMHLTGLHHHPNEDKVFSWKSAVHLVAFGITSILALMWELGQAKHYILNRDTNKKKKVFYIITLWYFFQAAIVTIWFLRIVVRKKITAYLDNVKNIEENGSVGAKSTRKMSKVIIALVVLNVAMSGYMASGANNVLFDDNDFNDVLIIRATQFHARMFMWQKKDYSAHFSQMIYTNVTDPTTERIVYGTMEIGLKFFGWLHYLTVKDVVLAASLTFRYYTNTYKEFLDKNGSEQISYPFLRKLWFNWDPMHQISSEIESHFGNLFKLLFVDNLLFGAYIVLDFMDEEFQFDGAFVIYVIVMGKVLSAYITAAIAGKLGSRVTSRLYKNSPDVGSNEDTDMMTNIGYFEKKIEKSPVAMGSGLFLVNEEFVYKFIGLVMSNALFVRDHLKEEAAAT